MAVQCTAEVIDRVTDGLKFRNLPQHFLYLTLRGIRQSAFAHLVQIVGNLHFHRVGDVLVFLYAREEFVELHLILQLQQLWHESEHSLAALGKTVNLLLCLNDAKFGCREQTATDKLQSVVFFLSLHRQHLADKCLNLLDKADVDDVEGCVEGGEFEEVVAATHHVLHKPTDGMASGIEHDEESHDTEHIEEHVGEGGTACLRVGGERSHECRNRGSYVLTHGKCGCLFKSKAGDVHAKEHQRDCHRGS